VTRAFVPHSHGSNAAGVAADGIGALPADGPKAEGEPVVGLGCLLDEIEQWDPGALPEGSGARINWTHKV
jgi:hypothetical protein